LSKGLTKYFTKILSMCGTAKNVDGALEEKEMDKLVENYVFKIKVVEFRTDKGGYPLYFVTMML